ncbi:hypothetical protein FRB93_000179 [Tulasnella sp. JGI-2019a]|nr:hypothetical protein FRB93_000179 [Tulasnella sp. JGI-2019a]
MVPPQQFKENTIVVIDTGRRNIYAGRGLHDFIQLPSVLLQARVGLRKSDISRLINGADAIDGMETLGSSSGQAAPPKGLRPSNYLVGRQLDQALADEEDIEVYWPFEEGKIADWVQAEALWKYLLFQSIQLRRTLNEFPVLLSFPKALSVDSNQRLAQLFFERFNVAAFSVFDRPVMQIFAANASYGIVVDIDEYTTDISCVWDGALLNGGSIAIPIGLADCERHLTNILMANTSLLTALSAGQELLSQEDLSATVGRFSTFLWTEGHVKPPSSAGVVVTDLGRGDEDPDSGANLAAIIVQGKEKALIEANSKKKGAAAARDAAEREREKERAALDLIDVEFEGKKITIGKERHRMCEPLLDPGCVRKLIAEGKDELASMSVQEGVYLATSRLEWSASGLEVIKRSAIWEAVQVTGKMTRVRTFGPALISYLQPYLTQSPATGANGLPVTTDQPQSSKYVRVPEYFANYRDRGDEFAAYLGANIVAKLTFNDPTGRFLSKTDYSNKGPAAISEIL